MNTQDCEIYEDNAGGLHLYDPATNRTCYLDAWDKPGLADHIRDLDWIDDVAGDRPDDVTEGRPDGMPLVVEVSDGAITLHARKMGGSASSFCGLLLR